MKRLHLIVGLGGVIAFLLTGQYMDRALGHLSGMTDLPRMLYRSGHIYLLFGALLNILLGVYITPPPAGRRRLLALTGSTLILISPVLFLIGFAVEPARTDFERPFAGIGIYGCFAGALLHALAHVGAATSVAADEKRARDVSLT